MDLGLLSRVLMAKLATDFRAEPVVERASAAAALAGNVERPSTGALPMATVTRTPAAEPQATGGKASLSPSGRWVAQLLGPEAAVTSTQIIATTQPIVDAAETPALIAKTLARVVAESGLFYESHVVEWALGKRGQADLLREPQARLTEPLDLSRPPAQTAGHQAGTPARGSADPLTARLPDNDELRGTDAASRPGTGVARDGEAAGNASPAEGRLPSDTARIVRHQLDALAAEQILWRGMLRPGERGEIEIGREHRAHASEAPDVWRARLALELPRLGAIEVAITLDAGNLSLAFRAADETRGTLAANAAQLQDALSAQDLRVHGLKFIDTQRAAGEAQ